VFPKGGWPISLVTDAIAEIAEPPLLVIRPESARSLGLVGDLWDYRDLLWSLADRDLRLRYRQTILGVAWVVLQPVLGALILTFVFGIVAGLGPDRGRYFLVTFASLAAWGLFSGITTRASASLVQNAGLVSKVWFPRVVIPWSTIPAALVDFAVALAVWTVFTLATGGTIPVGALLAPLWILGVVALAIGCGMVGAALMVSYRDVQHILPVALQLLLYASPVAYTAANVPERWLPLYWLNPIAPLLEGLRASLLGTPMPPTGMVWYAVGVVLGVLALAAIAFRRLERRFADVI
jgi:lipopolysaccharide transport system permease protein